MWIIETKDTPRSKWRRVKFSALYNTQVEAIKAASTLDPDGCPPDGVTIRVTRKVD
jgi:hypothetical protein